MMLTFNDAIALALMSGGGYALYRYLKMLIEGIEKEHAAEYTDDTVIPWTLVDQEYNERFIQHVLHCRECDPQDNPCSIGQQILDEWKAARNL
jgi:hypothetical protein